VLIHAWPLSSRMWESTINALTDAGYRAIAYDRRGFGDSGRPNSGYDYDAFTSDLNDLMTALDLEEAVLVGFSMGGGEVARYIARHGTSRVAKAALLGSVTPGLPRSASNPDGVDGPMLDGMIASVKRDRIGFLDSLFPNYYNWDAPHEGVSDDIIAYSKSIAWNASPLAVRDCITAFGTAVFHDDLAKFDVPTLVMHGDADRIVPPASSALKTAEMVKGSRLELIPGAPHGFAFTHNARLNEILLDFLKS